jgi:hypothetical protein
MMVPNIDKDPSSKRSGSGFRAWIRRVPTWVEVAALLLAAAAVAVPLVAISGNGSSSAVVPKPVRPAKLKVDSVVVSDYGKGLHPKPHLEVILHNLGGTRAVIDAASIVVTEVAAVKRCASQDDIPLSAVYGAVLPHHPSSRPVVVPLHDQVGPDGVDRFKILLSTPLGKPDPATYYLFHIKLTLLNDSPEAALPVASALVSLPEIPDQGEYFWNHQTIGLLKGFEAGGRPASELWAEAMPCWRHNTKILRRALAPPGVRSPEVASIADELVTPSFAELK